MKTLIVALVCLFMTNLSYAASLKVEGSCSGTLSDGSPVSFTYYSNYDGCRAVSRAAISFNQGMEGLFTGSRSFAAGKDIYSFKVLENRKAQEIARVTLADSTGNLSALLTYKDAESGNNKSVQVQCEIRDYEYGEC